MTDPTQIAGQPTGEPSQVDYVALRPGQTIGRFEIVAVLGQGGFGITYRARDVQLGREVAIKEYLPSALAVRQDGTTVLPRTTKMADDFGWGRERFVTEGRTMASLHHVPAIVKVFDYLEANGTAYIVMELLSGRTLEERIAQDGKLSPEEVDRILWPLLDGLEQVHTAGFLHRDIKPANILLDATGNPTLIDFGASRAAMAGRSTALTAIFTPGYAAAEQMTSAKQGPWTDIYGLSATLYHAIAGRVPPSAFDRMLNDTYEPLANLKPAGFAPGVLAGIDAGLAVIASDRPQSIGGCRRAKCPSAASEFARCHAQGAVKHDGFSWDQLNPSCLLQHVTPLRANEMRWNRMRFHLISFRSSISRRNGDSTWQATKRHAHCATSWRRASSSWHQVSTTASRRGLPIAWAFRRFI